ncbi:hypothetical protein J4G62_02425 [Aeromonas caviae]|uniref:hypothetical protein n=1 Tax=Aeromonas caviae TaxID=648 RepID=UPI001BD3FEC4|nr:hypothetical protein [Aeromonas caviae]MBS4719113.1 hypothetical protein [Aeromonas caviae]
MTNLTNKSADDLTDTLAYAGLVLLAYELLKSMIVSPIKNFYTSTTFSNGNGPFISYKHDVLSRHKNEFEACLLYLCDFMQAIDSNDLACIQSLRHHRNKIAHHLPDILPSLHIEDYAELFKATDRIIFKISNYRAYMEIGADPIYKDLDWKTAKGHEYLLYEQVLEKLQNLQERLG